LKFLHGAPPHALLVAAAVVSKDRGHAQPKLRVAGMADAGDIGTRATLLLYQLNWVVLRKKPTHRF